jgi:hypothetical protein
VLDLKMGTRQYGIEANEKKKKSQRRKCQSTTSQLCLFGVAGQDGVDGCLWSEAGWIGSSTGSKTFSWGLWR